MANEWYFPLNYADWYSPALRTCAPATRAFYIDCRCVMEQSNPPGFLKIGGNFLQKSDLGKTFGYTKKEAENHLAELVGKGVFEATEDGHIFCQGIASRRASNQKNAEKQARHRNKVSNGPAKTAADVTGLDNRLRNPSHNPKRNPSHNPQSNPGNSYSNYPPQDPLKGDLVPSLGPNPPLPGAADPERSPGPDPGIVCPMPDRFPFAADRRWAKRFWNENDRPELVAMLDVEVAKFRAHYGKRSYLEAGITDWGQAWRYWVIEVMNRTRKPNGHNGLSGQEALDAGIELARQLYAQHEAEQAAGVLDVQRNDRPPAPPRPALPDQRERPEKARDPDG